MGDLAHFVQAVKNLVGAVFAVVGINQEIRESDAFMMSEPF